MMAVVFAIIIWRSMGTGPSGAPNQGNLFPDDPAEIPDLSELEQGASMFVTIVDREDPTRVAGTLEADQFEPIGGGQRRLVNPDAWIYMRDGRRVHITADDGLVMMPDPNEAPDSGTLEGDVTIQSFDSADAQEASMIAKFDKPVEFERRYQRLSSDGRFTIESPGLEFIGHELTVMLNEVKGRVELLDVRRGERLVLRPNATKKDVATTTPDPVRVMDESEVSGSLEDTTAPNTPSRGTQQGVSPVAQESVEKQTPYHIEFVDEVMVDVVGTGTLRADGLDIWAMLVDGALSGKAIKQIKFAQQVDLSTQQSPPARESEGAGDGSVGAPTTALGQQSDGEIVMTWAGPLVVRPIEDPAVTALASEELALAFTSSSRVVFDTMDQGVHGSVDELRYGATSGQLQLVGSSDRPIEISADQAGTLRSSMLRADLDSGTIHIDTAGVLESIQATDEPRARIGWEDAAEFGLVKTEQGELTGRLGSAYFEGRVLGTRADAVLRTHSLRAGLAEDGPMESALRTITMERGSLNSDSGSLSGEEMVIGFVPVLDGSTVSPSTLDATGAVLGSSVDGRVETDTLNAILVREHDGQTRVRRASAIGDTEFLGKRETRAAGQRVNLDTDNDTIQILGDSSNLAQAGQGGSLIHGRDILINTRSRSIRVEGPGSFDHDIVTEGIATGGHLRVNWEESMRFDDAIGSIECNGDVVAVSTPDAYTIDTLKADRLEIDLTPAPGTDQITDPDAVLVDDGVQRELYEARAFGRAIPGGEPVLASVESRSYDPKNPERAIGVMYLEGSRLIADNRSQILRVPSTGMMVLMDRSEDQAGGQSGDSVSVMPSTSGPGLTRLTWLGSMELDRNGGSALVRDEVNIRHKSLTTGRVSQLGCDRLDASFSSVGEDQLGAITMQRAEASGRVRFTDLQRTLLSDHAIYDAANETLFAFADGDQLVTLRDSTEPTPVSARTLLWDLKKDLVEIDAPSPVRAPARP